MRLDIVSILSTGRHALRHLLDWRWPNTLLLLVLRRSSRRQAARRAGELGWKEAGGVRSLPVRESESFRLSVVDVGAALLHIRSGHCGLLSDAGQRTL